MKNFSRKKEFYYLIILFLLFLFHSLNNYVVVKNDTVPLIHDSSQLYQESINTFFLLKNRFSFRTVYKSILLTSRYPEGGILLLLSLPVYYIFGISQDNAMMVNTVFLFILIFSIYGIGKLIFSKNVGFFASIICILFPLTYTTTRNYLSSFALIAMITLDIFLLLKSDFLKNRIYSILLGLALIGTLFTKVTFSFYLLGPFISLFLINKNKILNDKKDLKKMAFNSIIVVAMIISVILICQFNKMIIGQLDYFDFQGETTITKNHSPFFLILFGYLMDIKFQLSFFFYFLLISVIYLLLVRHKYSVLFLSWIIIPPILFGLLFEQHFFFIKHTLPSLPAFALIISFFLNNLDSIIRNIFTFFKFKSRFFLSSKRLVIFKNITILTILFIGFLYYTSPTLKEKYFKDPRNDMVFLGRPYAIQNNWDPTGIMSLFEEYTFSRTYITIFFFNLFSEIDWALRNEIIVKNLIEKNKYFTIESCKDITSFHNYFWLNSEKCIKKIRNSDFIVFEEMELQHGLQYISPIYYLKETYREWEIERDKNFELIKIFNDSNYNEIEIWANKNLP